MFSRTLQHVHEANTVHSAKAAPAFMEQYQPVAFGLRPKEATGDLVADYEPEELK